jgi:predicted metal-dependent hydrolase
LKENPPNLPTANRPLIKYSFAVAADSTNDLFDQGIKLFNQGEFFDCHEVWEEIWKRSSGPEKMFLQGLIQAAVAILHAQRGNLDGAASLYKKSRAKLDRFPPRHAGIALAIFRADLEEFFAAVSNSDLLPPAPKLVLIE